MRHHTAEMALKLSGAVVPVAEVLNYLRSDQLLNRREAAHYLRISVRKLDSIKALVRYRIEGKGRTLFKKSELESVLVGEYPKNKQIVVDDIPEIQSDREPELDRMAEEFLKKWRTKTKRK